MRRTTMALLAVLLLGGTIMLRTTTATGKSQSGMVGAMYEPPFTMTRVVSSHTNGSGRPPATIFLFVMLCGSRKRGLLRWGGNDKGLYCQIVGKFRKAKDGVPQLVKLKGVTVIDAKSVKSGR
jgi:hypothetical protein